MTSILLNTLTAGPSFSFRNLTMSDWVSNRNASPSICCKKTQGELKLTKKVANRETITKEVLRKCVEPTRAYFYSSDSQIMLTTFRV